MSRKDSNGRRRECNTPTKNDEINRLFLVSTYRYFKYRIYNSTYNSKIKEQKSSF